MAMETRQFTDGSPGRLVPIGGAERVFVPEPLPPVGWEPSRVTLQRLAEAKEAIGELRGVTSLHLLPRPESLLSGFRSAEARASSNIEGTHAGPEDLLLARAAETTPELQAHVAPDALEVRNLERALTEGEAVMRDQGLSLWLIRRIHQTLLTGSRGGEKDPGRFRSIQVYIGTDHRFVPAPGGDIVQSLMEDLERYWKSQGDAIDPLVRCFLVHYQFETIHPFRDGNGRTGRALLSLMCTGAGRFSAPWLHFSPYFEEHRDDYFRLLFGVSARGVWDEWVSFCCDAAAVQATRATATCRRLIKLRESWEDLVRKRRIKTSYLPLLDRFLALEAISVAEAARIMGVRSYTTAKRHLELLAADGVVAVFRDGVPLMYYAPEAVRIVYGRNE